MGLGEGGRKRAAAMRYLVGLPSYQNLRERLKEVMDRKQDCLPEVEERASDGVPAKAQGIKDNSPRQMAEPEKHYRTGSATPNQRSEGMRYDDFQKQVRRDKRVSHYEDVRTLVEQGLSQRAIARKLKLARAIVSKFAQAQAYPETHHPKRGERKSILNPYKGYVLHRWQQGCTNGAQLYDEIKARGYLGSEALRRHVSRRTEEKAPGGRLGFGPDPRCCYTAHRNSSFPPSQTPYYTPPVCNTRILALCQSSRKAY